MQLEAGREEGGLPGVGTDGRGAAHKHRVFAQQCKEQQTLPRLGVPAPCSADCCPQRFTTLTLAGEPFPPGAHRSAADWMDTAQ